MKILHCFKKFGEFHTLYIKVIILARKGNTKAKVRAISDVRYALLKTLNCQSVKYFNNNQINQNKMFIRKILVLRTCVDDSIFTPEVEIMTINQMQKKIDHKLKKFTTVAML